MVSEVLSSLSILANDLISSPMMCRTNGPSGALFLITQKFVFLEVLLAMFCFVPNSHIFQVGIGKKDSKRLSVVSGGQPKPSNHLGHFWMLSCS